MTFSDLINSLSDNPYFGAGFGLVGVGAGVATLRKGLQVATILFKRNCMITLEVPSRDRSYQWLLQWITKNAQNTQHISVETHFEQQKTGRILTYFNFVPSVGVHAFQYKGTWIRVERNREQVMDMNIGVPFETVTLTSLGRNKTLYVDMLDEARRLALTRHEGKTVMYTPMGHEWREFGHARKRRPLSSVILEEGKADRIVQDIKEFINSPKWYEDRGIPYRRGYLLHGPPGGGKTSFITALAGELEYSICVLNLSDRGLTDDRLNHLMAVAPAQSIILLEDIDAIFASREVSEAEQRKYEGLSLLTLSGLLNMLDGVVSSEGRLIFMTTNYLSRLDPALIRPGRVDLIEYIGHATDGQLLQAFKNFYPEEPDSSAQQFVAKVRELNRPVSMAAVQGYFMMYKFEPSEALSHISSLGSKVIEKKPAKTS